MEIAGNVEVTNHDWYVELVVKIYEVDYSVEQELEHLDGTSVTLRLVPQQRPQNRSQGQALPLSRPCYPDSLFCTTFRARDSFGEMACERANQCSGCHHTVMHSSRRLSLRVFRRRWK